MKLRIQFAFNVKMSARNEVRGNLSHPLPSKTFIKNSKEKRIRTLQAIKGHYEKLIREHLLK